MNDWIIEVDGVSKSFDQGRIPVLTHASLKVRERERVALWGSSGSGKTTLLNLIGGLELPDRGTLKTGGLDPTKDRPRLDLRRRIVGFVFQLHNLIPYLTVRENMLIPAVALGVGKDEAETRVKELLRLLGMEHRIHHRMQDLSGGERQRTAIGRALINRPRILLADEPTGALDESTADRVFGLLKDLSREVGVTVVMATHERRFAEACDRIYRVTSGRVEEACA
ncbi:ABC transporter ATP-binding protein [Puniceicoccus vermicola]|uniref:ABC transporter ATP-binding protein n=1 Tax=Puniceicoccus vermicola TaxID=388746 RepID=A0A7X1B3Q3_9BACT|nr:ABC transporter ATP-binding protein [Puniceicoccus vermicola]MBC2603958.1 ABC transporter ATP-binding protein [Puniceicoccus vermicola]